MSAVKTEPAFPAEVALLALPFGVAVVDAKRRIALMNPAFHVSLDLPPDTISPGTAVDDALRAVNGKGDREGLIIAALAADQARSTRLCRRTCHGRSLDLYHAPLADGGYVICTIETTPLPSDREEAEHAPAPTVTALARAGTGIATFEPTGTVVFANSQFAHLLALPPEGVPPGTTFSALLDRVAAGRAFAGTEGHAFIAALRAIDRFHPAAARRRFSDGRVLEITSDPLPGGGWTMMLTEAVTQAEDEASRHARSLAEILDALPHGVCVFGPDLRVRMFNRAYSRIMDGAPVALGEHRLDIVRRYAEAGEYGRGQLDELIANLATFKIAPPYARRRRPNGTVIEVRNAALPDGGFISVVTDVTPQSQARAEFARRADEMAAMLGSIRHGVLLWGPDRRLIASNAISARLLNTPPGLLTPGRSLDEVLDRAVESGELGDEPEARATAEGIRAVDRSRPFRHTVRFASGRSLEIRSDPTPSGGWVTTFTDATDQHHARDELRRAKEAAEAANQAKSRFLATMSHELRTPLHAVIGFSDALKSEAAHPSPVRVQEFADQINEAGRNLLALINSILDVARIEAGRFDLRSEDVDVVRLVRHGVRQADASAQAAEIALVTELAPELPRVRGDERRLQQVLRQLLSNAIKFTGIGGTITIGATAEPQGDLLIFVRDNGIGIAADDLERVFEPFTQLDATLARRFQGSGLGLYMSRALITGHGGRLTLRSRKGEGTTAEIRLPSAHLVQDEEPPTSDD